MAANPRIFTIWPFTESLCQPLGFFNLCWLDRKLPKKKNHVLFFFFLALLGLCCCAQAFSSCREQGLLSSCGVQASLYGGFPWLQITGFRVRGLQFLGCMRLDALRHVGSSQTRNQTHVSCTGRQILCHWSNREIQEPCVNCFVLCSSLPGRAVVCSKYWPGYWYPKDPENLAIYSTNKWKFREREASPFSFLF